MSIGPWRALVIQLNASVLGVPIIIRRPPPDEAPIDARGVWLDSADEPAATGTDFRRREPRRVMGVALSPTLPSLPRGTVITATDRDESTTTEWQVDGLRRMDVDSVELILVRTGAI